MEAIPIMLLLFYILFFGVSAVIVIYLIIKRIQNRGNEGFEERDN